MEKRILLDTNIYGILLEDKQFFDSFTPLISSSFIIYGSALIRKELRDISTQAEFHGKKKRVLLLTIYDSFIRKEKHKVNNKYNFHTPILYTYNSFKEYTKRFQLR